MFINILGFTQDLPKKEQVVLPKPNNDTLNIVVDSIPNLLANQKVIDSTDNDTIVKKEFLEDIVTYKAKDYVSINQKNQKIYLYNEAQVNYQDLEIKAGTIVIDYTKNLVYAGRLKDSTGYSQRPVFTQGANVIEPDSIIFNTDSKKALVFNSVTEQSGGTVITEVTKKENDSVFFISKGKFTTSENLDDPEYYILMRRAKIVPKKKIVTGPAQMYIYDVPTPIYMPFAFFPMSNKQTSGIIFPSYGEDTGNDRGYFLQNGGYYFAISDYLDLAVLGDYYTNGSYALRFETNYAKRYAFSGNFRFRYESLINSERGFSDFNQSIIYNIAWSHAQDAKANPNSRFSASVNLGSSEFFQQSINQTNQGSFLNNTLASSVSYSKTFQGEPQVNVNLSATHSQNTQSGNINLTLPTVQVSMSRVFPFEPKNGNKKGALQNINFQINTRGEYRINTNDSIFGTSEMFEDAITGMQHNAPINTNFKIFDYFNIGANANFQETWVLKTFDRIYDQTEEQFVTIDRNGFDRYLTYNFGASIGTTLYGLYNFKKKGKNPKIQAIRHVIRPSISYSLNPDFGQYYETVEAIDADGNSVISDEFTRFQGAFGGAPSNQLSSSIGIGIGNNFEAKIREKDSTKTEPKKVFLLNNLNIGTAYNIVADSLNWSSVRVTGGTQIFNQKMNINFGMTLDPYALDNNNRRINTFNIDNGGSLFRLTTANLNINYSLSNDTFSGGGNEKRKTTQEQRAQAEAARTNSDIDGLFGVSDDFADKRLRNNDKEKKDEDLGELYNYKIPWNLRLAYVVNYSNAARQNAISGNSLMFTGDIELSPRWSVGVSSGYDFLNKGFTFTQLRFERDLLSWRMNFQWVPFGNRTSWNFFIGIRSNLLKDLKYDQRRQPDIQLGN